MDNSVLNNLQAGLKSGKLSRREFIMSMLAAGVVLPSALTMSSQVLASVPKRGGVFRQGFGHGSTTDSLDPATSENGLSQSILFSYGNCLTEVNNDGQLVPELAESVESTDAKTWTIALRKGVEFHNGKSLTADDVIASLNHHRGEGSKSAAKGLLAPVVELKKDGDHTIIVELDNANADFPFIISDYHLIIMPADKDGAIDANAGIGTGGYKITNYEPGVRFQSVRNENYFKEGRAHFDEYEALSLLDTTARQNAIMNGDVDVIDKVDPKTVSLLARVPSLNILEVTGTLHYTFPMRVDAEPFSNYDLRMALKLAVNRQEMVDKILLGHGVVGNDHPISSSVPYYAADLPQREYDPEKAAEHFKKSGVTGPIQLSVSDAAFAGAVDAAQLMKASAAVAGIEIDIVREPKDGYWSNVWNKKPWTACYWGGRPTVDWMFSSAYVEETEWNDTAWRTSEAAQSFNELVKQARAELDEAKRAEMYAECQRLISDDGGALVPMFANHIHAVSKKVAHDEQVAGNWQNDGNKSHERWWFA